jgi:ribokinase
VGQDVTRPVVIGHLEWSHLLRVARLPAAGEIGEVSAWDEFAAGSACVAAVQLAKLAGGCDFFTAVGNDERAARATTQLEKQGVSVHAVQREGPTRKALVLTDSDGERTIIVHGERHSPRYNDPLPWDFLESADCALVTAGDHQVLQAARKATFLVLTARAMPRSLDVEVDAVVGSDKDPTDRLDSAQLEHVGLVVSTRGHEGGTFRRPDGSREGFIAPPFRSPVVDTYGAGDSFAAGLTFALARGLSAEEAVKLAALCGTAVLSGRGPYESQLTKAAFLDESKTG